MIDEERAAEIERLEAKLVASENKDGLAQRVEAINARLKELRDAG